MKKWAILLCSITLCACTTVAERTTPLFSDQLFSAPSEYVGADQVFALNADMKHFLDTKIAEEIRVEGPQEALYNALYTSGLLKLDYDSAMTRTASQAFDARSGNCLSMAIMTAAMAKEIGLKVQFRRVHLEESWSRVGQTYFFAGHVNVTLLEKRPWTGLQVARPMTIDFVPPDELKNVGTDDLEENTIIAMYMNNKAAESLAARHLDNAYWWARAAIRQDPNFLNAYNTLGVIYKAHGNLAEAEQVLRQALALQPGDVVVMSNLAGVLNALGRVEEYQALTYKVEQLRPYPPFYFFDQGRAAMKIGDFKTAKKLFKKEIDRAPDYHEFQYWYAIANLGLGDIGMAEKYMSLAVENSTTRKDYALYAAKLDKIKSLEKAHQRDFLLQ